jgi:site-specific DNA recombinase
MKCAIYLRISMDSTGKEAGVDDNAGPATSWPSASGGTSPRSSSNNDISAFTGKMRPGFEAMLDAIKRGQVTAVVCWHTDRLYRKVKDLLRLLDASSGLEIRTVEGGDIDLSNATGRMVATILGSVSTNESEHHAERRRAANKARALAGEWVSTGSRPFGFNPDGTHREPEASMIQQAAKDILAGKSLHAVAREWNASGVTTARGVKWSNLHIRRVLTNPRVAAQRVHQGKIIGTGNWEPIIDEAIWRGLGAFLADPSRKNAVAFERRYIGSGVYKCGYRTPDADPDDPDSICGRRLYAAHPHGRDRSMVYCCRPVVHLGRNGAELDRMVETIAFAHLLDNAIGSGLRQAEDQVDIGAMRTERDALQATKDQLATLLRKGILDVAGVERESAILTAQIADLNAKMAEAAQGSPLALLLEDGEDPEALADEEKLAERWTRASPDIKGKIISMIFDVVVLPAPGKRVFDPDLIEIRWR